MNKIVENKFQKKLFEVRILYKIYFVVKLKSALAWAKKYDKMRKILKKEVYNDAV